MFSGLGTSASSYRNCAAHVYCVWYCIFASIPVVLFCKTKGRKNMDWSGTFFWGKTFIFLKTILEPSDQIVTRPKSTN